MVTQSMWLFFWIKNEPWAFIVASFINSVMLSTGLVILQKTMYANLNMFEIISFRAGFSIYIGWLTAAQIVQFIYIFYSSGLKSNQVRWSQFILVVAYAIYTAYGFIERNPLMPLVFIWTLAAIRSDQHLRSAADKEWGPEIANICSLLMYVHWATLAGMTGLCAYEMSNKTYTHGLFL
jgi:hypothetical protein